VQQTCLLAVYSKAVQLRTYCTHVTRNSHYMTSLFPFKNVQCTMLSTKYDLISLNQIQKGTTYSSVHANWSSPKRPNKFLAALVQYLWYRVHLWSSHLKSYKETGSTITIQTELYLCINQLHVSVIYSHHQPVHRILNKKNHNTIQQKPK
jgi:hypothetical protein